MVQNFKKILVVIIISILAIMLYPNISNAGGYAAKKGGTRKTNEGIMTFWGHIREMQSGSGTLGVLAEEGHGINCHMAKATEWGTIALLAASAYGNAPKGTSSASTTGNNSGVYEMASGAEIVVGVWTGSDASKRLESKYKNVYENNNSSEQYPGDAKGMKWLRGRREY